MSKLSSLSPHLNRLPSSIANVSPQEKTRSARRYAEHSWRKWYGRKSWKDLRWKVLVDSAFTCVRCGTIEGDTSQLVADHKIPHRGREDLFWDENNIQCMCKVCHDTVKQREEQSQIVGVWD